MHPLVINPRLAFTADPLGVGFQQNFVIALEFRRILDQLWDKGWTLVDVHRAAQGTVRVPEGRRPLVLSEDDVNYYHYFNGRGLADRLVLHAGTVEAELPGGRLTDEDVVPLVDAEVARHPEFSADGAKGMLVVTGYEGLFGEHQPDQPGAACCPPDVRVLILPSPQRVRRNSATARHQPPRADTNQHHEAQ